MKTADLDAKHLETPYLRAVCVCECLSLHIWDVMLDLLMSLVAVAIPWQPTSKEVRSKWECVYCSLIACEFPSVSGGCLAIKALIESLLRL